MALAQYTAANLLSGMAGAYNIVKNGGTRMYFALHTRLVMKVTGTELKFTGTSEYGSNDNVFQFSIDGGTFAAAASRVGDVHTVYTGLSDIERTVIIRAHPGASGAAYCIRSGNVMDVTGASPSMSTLTNWESHDSSVANTNVALRAQGETDWHPDLRPQTGGNSATYGPNITCIQVRGAYTTINVVNLSNYGVSEKFYVSVDGGTPAEYTSNAAGFYQLTGLSGVHDYFVWGSSCNAYGDCTLVVGGDIACTNITPKKRLDVFGSSTTRGNAATTNGKADVFAVAAHFGFAGCSHGADGDTFASLNTRIVAATSSKTYNNAADCCYVAIGRNDVYGGYNATGQTNFNAIITRLRGIYSKVIVRGLLPSYSTGDTGFIAESTADNITMGSWVTALGFGNVYYVDPIALGWSGPSIDRAGDGVHPSDSGYYTITQYELTAFAGVLGSAPATGVSACTVWMI
jgi:hypothetical protein